ncbi:MAG: M14 family metallopeptidase [Hyphomicrobiales bacterium]|nr:M14 family metallopeptidase [Hyphomicrobiales bacterium]
MTAAACFASDYTDARRRFLAAADAAGAIVWTYDHPLRGPDGEPLAMDVAWLGPADATAALILSSATHGVEGFCGSGCQVAAMRDGLHRSLPPGLALVLVHGHNPHGFAHLRRVTEENVDLNRNFPDFSGPLPENLGYAQVHPWLTPADWHGAGRAAADAAIADYRQAQGLTAFQAVVSKGQHDFPDGLFYGGQAPTWSRRTIERLCAERLAGLTRIALIDVHTGLGPRGHGEIIAGDGPNAGNHRRARDWFGEDAKCPERGESVSAAIPNTVEKGYAQALRRAEVTAVALEYGTIALDDVFTALRADNWLHLHGRVASAEGREIKAMMRAAFHGEDAAWKTAVWQRAEEVIRRTIAALAG